MTQLYLISPPKIELADFRKQLEAALTTNLTPTVYGGGKGGASTTTSREVPPPLSPPAGGGGIHSHLIGAFQLRLKDADDAEIRAAISELLPICRAHEVAFIINDRVDLCAELYLDGVHVGQEDLHRYIPSPLGGGLGRGHDSTHSDQAPLPTSPLQGEELFAHIRSIIGEEAVLGVTCHASKHLAMEAGEFGADYVAFGAFYPTTSKPIEKLEKWGTPTSDIIEWWTTTTTLPCVAIGGITPANCKPLVSAGADFIAVINAVWNHPKGAQAAVKEFAKELI